MFLVRCPRCKQKMKYNGRKILPGSKRCVYCGHSFRVKDNIIQEIKG